MLENWKRKVKYRRMMDGGRGAGDEDGGGGGGGAGVALATDLSMCFQCGNLIENTVTYCHTCYDLRSESDFRNEQRWRNLESNLLAVEADLQKERAATKRLEGTLQSFRHMLLQGIHADVTIETGEFDKTPAHRAVLVSIARMPLYFMLLLKLRVGPACQLFLQTWCSASRCFSLVMVRVKFFSDLIKF